MISTDKTLARLTASKAERFLSELANLQQHPESVLRFINRFEKVLPSNLAEMRVGATEIERLTAERLGEAIVSKDTDAIDWLGELEKEIETRKGNQQSITSRWVLKSQQLLRLIWQEQDLRTKEWGVMILREWSYFYTHEWSFSFVILAFSDLTPDSLPKLPPPTLLEQAVIYLLKSADRARYCANPECPAPYFFVKRRSQKYCSDACAQPAQRALKRQWWAEHGEEWRKQRQGRKSSSSKSKKVMPKLNGKRGKVK